MKILNIIDIPWNSGLAAYAFEQSDALSGRGHGVFFAAPEGSAAAAFARSGSLPLSIIPPRRDPFVLGALYGLKKTVDKNGIDVVNAHTGRAQTMAWILSKITAGSPALVRTKADAKRPSVGFTMGKAALVIAGSGTIKTMYTGAGLAPERIEVIYQGIAAAPAGSGQEPLPPKIGILGRLDPVKGHLCFLEAAALVLEKFPSAEFLIAGREENIKYSALRRRAEELGVAGRVGFMGHVPDAAEFNRSCGIGVIASLGSEAVSRAALEWMAAGRPLVATAVGCLPELVAPEWLVPPKDPAAMADRLISLLRSPEAMRAAGERNRTRAVEDLAPAAFAERTERAFLKAARGA